MSSVAKKIIVLPVTSLVSPLIVNHPRRKSLHFGNHLFCKYLRILLRGSDSIFDDLLKVDEKIRNCV